MRVYDRYLATLASLFTTTTVLLAFYNHHIMCTGLEHCVNPSEFGTVAVDDFQSQKVRPIILSVTWFWQLLSLNTNFGANQCCCLIAIIESLEVCDDRFSMPLSFDNFCRLPSAITAE